MFLGQSVPLTDYTDYQTEEAPKRPTLVPIWIADPPSDCYASVHS